MAGLATVLGKEGQKTAAISYWRQALSVEPQNASLHFALGLACLDNNENKEAADQFRQVLNNDPTSGDALLDLGAALARQDRYQEAVEVYRRALLVPSVADSARLSLIKGLVTLLKFSEALPYIQQELAIHSDRYQSHYLAGLAYKGLGELQPAESELNKATIIDGNAFEGLLALATVERQMGQQKQAIDVLQRAAKLQPSSREVHFQLAQAYRASRRPELAAREEGILRSEEQAAADATKALVLKTQAARALDAHNLAGAIELDRQRLLLAPQDANARYDLALLFDQAGRLGEERALLAQALVLDPALAAAHGQLGYLEMREGHTEEAEAQLRAALKQNPECVEALGNLGVLYARRGRYQEAARLLRMAVEANGHYGRGYLNLGLVLAAQHNYGEAQAALEQAHELLPEDPSATAALKAIQLNSSKASFPGH